MEDEIEDGAGDCHPAKLGSGLADLVGQWLLPIECNISQYASSVKHCLTRSLDHSRDLTAGGRSAQAE